MKLLIISNMPHYERDGRVLGWGPTVQEIDALATVFDRIVHLGCLYPEPAPLSAIPYQAKNLQLVPLRPAGGESLQSKLDILRLTPAYLSTIREWLPWADVVHVRCPGNIPMLALGLLATGNTPKYRWVKYAGNWSPSGREPWSYTLQRWMLHKDLHRGAVTVNGEWKDQPAHVHSFHNPSLTRLENVLAAEFAHAKQLEPPYRFLFVGRVESAKGVGTILKIARMLREKNLSFRIDLIGDGPEKDEFERMAEALDLNSHVQFRGWLPRSAIEEYYRLAHFILLPSFASEGWPKVLSEGMAYGVVPIASNVSSIPQILSKLGTGKYLPSNSVQDFFDAILDYINHPLCWENERSSGIAAANLFTYDNYLLALQQMFQDEWGISLKNASNEPLVCANDFIANEFTGLIAKKKI